MSHHIPHSDDPTIQAYFEKVARRDRRTEHFFRRALHIIERVIAALAILALLPIWLYNGRKGNRNKALQYGCYGFYPVHMIVLYLIAVIW